MFQTLVLVRISVERSFPFRLAELAGESDSQPTEAFAALASETRLAILLALWDAMDPGTDAPGPPLSVSDLYDRVAYDEAANFHYHLEKLTGEFVDKVDGGHALTTSAERILSTVLAGTLADAPSFADEQIDAACMLCGTPTVVDYSDGVLTRRCTRVCLTRHLPATSPTPPSTTAERCAGPDGHSPLSSVDCPVVAQPRWIYW